MTTTPAQTTVDRYKAAAIALLPPGESLSKSDDGDLADVLEAISVEPARLHEDAAALLVNYDPARADELLPEWENALGITRPSGTLAERRGALITKLRGRTNHAKSVFEDSAISLGYGEETWVELNVPVQLSSAPDSPPVMKNGRWRFSFISPVASGFTGLKQLVCFGPFPSSIGFYLNGYSGNCALTLNASDSDVAWPRNITFSAGQRVSVEVDTRAGTFTVSGAATGNGTTQVNDFAGDGSPLSFTFSTGELRIGYGYGGSYAPFDGNIGAFETIDRTGIEFVTYDPLVAGVAAAGDSCYGDEWANVVRMYVSFDTQTAERALFDAFEYLRRSHGYFDIILEGPMGAERRADGAAYYFQASMSSDGVLANLTPLSIRYGGYASIQVLIDNGAGGAPTDNPVGVWELYSSTDGSRFAPVTGTAVTSELAKIAPNGNNVVNTFAIFDKFPGRFLKLRYNQTSGGTGNSRMTVDITTW